MYELTEEGHRDWSLKEAVKDMEKRTKEKIRR